MPGCPVVLPHLYISDYYYAIDLLFYAEVAVNDKMSSFPDVNYAYIF